MTPRQANSHEPDGSGCFLFGLLIGGLAGVAVALWNAPKSGAALRQQIVDQVGASRRQVMALLFGERMQDAVAEGKAIAQQRQTTLAQGE